MQITANELRCYYCLQRISVDDDAQRIEKRKFAHTPCACAASDAFFFFVFDAESEQSDTNENSK